MTLPLTRGSTIKFRPVISETADITALISVALKLSVTLVVADGFFKLLAALAGNERKTKTSKKQAIKNSHGCLKFSFTSCSIFSYTCMSNTLTFNYVKTANNLTLKLR